MSKSPTYNMDDIHNAIALRFQQHKYKLYNSYVFEWESDYFSVTQDEKYIYEVEIKLSRSDFKNDFSKSFKHKLLLNTNKKLITKSHGNFGQYIDAERVELYNVSYVNPQDKTPNRFYYCCPEGMIKESELPPYAGLLYIRKDGNYVTQVKTAPVLHKQKNVDKYLRLLVDKFYFQWEKMRTQYKWAKYLEKNYERLQAENSKLNNLKYIHKNVGFINEIERLKEENSKLRNKNSIQLNEIIGLKYKLGISPDIVRQEHKEEINNYMEQQKSQ